MKSLEIKMLRDVEAPKQTAKRGISELVTPGNAEANEQKAQPKEEKSQGFHR